MSRLTKVTNIKLSVYVAIHSSIRSVDHLSDLLKTMGKGCDLQNLRLYRAKCSSIVKHVVAPYFTTKLKSNVGIGSYSFILDKSTDVSVHKYLH